MNLYCKIELKVINLNEAPEIEEEELEDDY